MDGCDTCASAVLTFQVSTDLVLHNLNWPSFISCDFHRITKSSHPGGDFQRSSKHYPALVFSKSLMNLDTFWAAWSQAWLASGGHRRRRQLVFGNFYIWTCRHPVALCGLLEMEIMDTGKRISRQQTPSSYQRQPAEAGLSAAWHRRG